MSFFGYKHYDTVKFDGKIMRLELLHCEDCHRRSPADGAVGQRLVHFELLQFGKRPFVFFERDMLIVKEPIMGYGHFEGEDGGQSILPLIFDPVKGELKIICDNCDGIEGMMPPYYDEQIEGDDDSDEDEALVEDVALPAGQRK